jgi:hypothetical protein
MLDAKFIPAADVKPRDRHSLSELFCHHPARVHAFSGFLDTSPHLIVVLRHHIAIFRGLFVDIGAELAHFCMELRIAAHEVGVHFVYLRAIDQQADMGRIGMLPAFTQTVVHCFDAYLMRASTIIDALLHLHIGNRLCMSHFILLIFLS